MGVLNGKDVFNSKFITAIITDQSGRILFVPIKAVLGDYFLADIDRQLYVFRLDGSRIKTYRHTLVKSFRVIMYDTSHYLPVAPENLTELAQVLQKNGLPKMNMMLFSVLKLLGKREKANFEPHNIVDLVTEIQTHENEYSDQVRSIVNYLEHLKVEQIVTPVRKITEFIEGDLIATDPRYFGDVVLDERNTNEEHKRITNTPISGKHAWIKWVAILGIVAMIGGLIAYLYSTGSFDNLGSGFTGMIPGGNDPNSIMKTYPTPEALKSAIDAGKVDYTSLPNDIKKMVDNFKPPTLKPNP